MTARRKDRKLANHEIVTIAVYMLGGASKPVDTEDIAKKANELAPGRFIWRKYTDQIDKELIRVFLSDAKKEKNGALLSGAGNDGWLLTQGGNAFAKANIDSVGGRSGAHYRITAQERRWRQTERARMLASEAYQIFRESGTEGISEHVAEGFFRIDSYIVGITRERKIERLLNVFGDDAELGKIVRELAAIIRKEK